jgi:arylsulfatase A-like enzyme
VVSAAAARRGAAAAALAGLALLNGCGHDEPVAGAGSRLPELLCPEGPPAALRGAPVVVILLDALNPSFLTCYGGRADLTPHIDALAAEGVRFTQAIAPAAYTISSIASLLTGVGVGAHHTWTWKPEGNHLPADLPTLAERFAAAGYATAAIVHSPNGSTAFGFDRGFQHFVDLWKVKRPYPRAEDCWPALDELLAARDERPLFLWLHILEPHEPYHPPDPWRGRLDPGYTGTFTGDPVQLWSIRNREVVPDARDLAHLRAEYEETIAYADHAVGGIRERLERAGLWDRAIVVLVSDHGEGFLEHQGLDHAGMGHGSTVYDEMIRVPLIVKLPRGAATAGAVQAQLVASLDLLPALAELVGAAPAGAARAPGRDAVATHSGSHEVHRLLATWSLRDARWKYMDTPGHPPELYDLAADPGEHHDLAAEQPGLVESMRRRLAELAGADLALGATTGAEGPAPPADSPELQEQLRALGYVR